MATLSLEARALRLLAQREHSRAELARKLSRRLPDEDSGRIAALLDDLAARGWLSDERTAEAVVRSLAPRAGVRKVEQVLRAKGLPAELRERSLAAAKHGELERARALWQRKFGEPPLDAGARARQQRFLAGRGFETETILRLMHELQSPRGRGDEPPAD